MNEAAHLQTAITTPRLDLAKLIGSLSQNPYVGTLGVFLGAGIVTLNGRLISVGLPDLRGAMGLGIDEASWIPTAYNMALMYGSILRLPWRFTWAQTRAALFGDDFQYFFDPVAVFAK